jgi:hypothetical protein
LRWSSPLYAAVNIVRDEIFLVPVGSEGGLLD